MLILLVVISFKFVNNQYRWPPQSGQLFSWEAYSPHEELSSVTKIEMNFHSQLPLLMRWHEHGGKQS